MRLLFDDLPNMALRAGALVVVVVMMTISPFGEFRAASASEMFDGRWTLEVTTDQGVCRSYRELPIRVSEGTIRPVGLAGLLGTVGQVAHDGSVTFEMRHRGHVVSADGLLREEIGGGRWVSTRGCVGHWQASRR